MRNSLITFLLLIGLQSWAQTKDIFIKKLTNINPVSYTDVIFIGIKDTVLVSTYSGRIAKVIQGINKEKVLADIDDEIYALAYNKIKKEILASTLENGLVIINEKSGKIIKKIPLNASWANAIVYSEDFKYITVHDQKGKRYIFDTQGSYTNVDTGTIIPVGRIVKINKDYIATIAAPKKIIQWSLPENRIIKEWNAAYVKFADIDAVGNSLSIDFNECSMFNPNAKTVEFKIKHPNWPLPNPENNAEVYEIPYQMQLNAAKFARHFIYTAGIDRSVRVWEKSTGKLVSTLLGHNGSISKMRVSNDESQVVSVDLKGVIKFWDVK